MNPGCIPISLSLRGAFRNRHQPEDRPGLDLPVGHHPHLRQGPADILK